MPLPSGSRQLPITPGSQSPPDLGPEVLPDGSAPAEDVYGLKLMPSSATWSGPSTSSKPVRQSSKARNTRADFPTAGLNSAVEYTGAVGGFDVFMSGITIHFKPIRYDHIRDWVVTKIGDVYSNMQSSGVSMPDIENGLFFLPRLRQESSEDARRPPASKNEREPISTSTATHGSSGDVVEPSFIHNAVSGIYFFLNSADRSSSSQPDSQLSTRTLPSPLSEVHEELFAGPRIKTVDPVYIEDEDDKYSDQVLNSFNSSSDGEDEDYDILYLDEENGTAEPVFNSVTQLSAARKSSENDRSELEDVLEIVSSDLEIEESEMWDMVSQNEADECEN